MEQRYETFTVLIARISRNIRKIKNQEMASYGLRSVHISCLYYLYLAGELTATGLCERCEEDKATVSHALDYLEKNGYIARAGEKTKRYKSTVTLTEKGMEAGKKIAEKINRVLDEVSVSLTGEQRAAFYKSLSLISGQLEIIAQKCERED